jgi:hypothetical protein
MPAMGWRGIFRPCKARSAADAGCIGKDRNAAGAEKTRQTAPTSSSVSL